MIIVVVLIVACAVGTVLVCKSISAGFDAKDQNLDQMEKGLVEELENLRRERRNLKRDLNDLKKELKSGAEIRKKQAPNVPSSLKSWLIDTELVEYGQYSKAEKYAEEKNLDMLSALLTLSMITVDTYEKAKKMKLR